MRRDENNVIIPVSRDISDAERLPTAAQQRKKADTDGNNETEKDTRDSGKPIGKQEITEAKARFMKYEASMKMYKTRFKNNFDTYNLLYTENSNPQFEKSRDGERRKKLIPKRIGGQSLNVILNKHADAMDNYPEPIFLPRSKDDEDTARMLNSIVPCILERNKYRKTYSRTWDDKLVGGTCIVSVTWDADRENGLGDIAINRVDIMNCAWEPHLEDVQQSKDFFVVDYIPVDEVKERYPVLKDVSSEDLGLTEYTTPDTESKTKDKAAVFDWYYKRDGVLHFCKFCGETVIFASENEPEDYPHGFYEHGRYPFEITPLFQLKDTCTGFGFIDITRAPQEQLDDLKCDILKNIKVNSQTRSLVSSNAGVNIDDLNDLSVDFVEASSGNLNGVTYPLETKDIAGGALSIYNSLIEEIKDTTGTNDPANGAGAAGVTSGSAIAALQEAGGKISRDINKAGYEEFAGICELIIELMRQFYTPARWFRIIGEDKKPEYVEFDNSGLVAQNVSVEGNDEDYKRLPVFDIQVKAQRSNPFTTAANNQMMIDMFRMGAFAPENADAALAMLEGMSFEGKDKLVELIKKNQTLLNTVQELSGRLQMSNAALEQQMAMSQGIPEQAQQMPTQG